MFSAKKGVGLSDPVLHLRLLTPTHVTYDLGVATRPASRLLSECHGSPVPSCIAHKVHTPTLPQLCRCRLRTPHPLEGPERAYVEVLEAFEVILSELRDVIVLQVQQCGVRGDLLGHSLQTWGPAPPSPV